MLLHGCEQLTAAAHLSALVRMQALPANPRQTNGAAYGPAHLHLPAPRHPEGLPLLPIKVQLDLHVGGTRPRTPRLMLKWHAYHCCTVSPAEMNIIS